ncbi:MAG TPA: galactokinase [Terriglobales bacterium]|jgi:galactokinase|nr:galactokinase [Terriglobales bacterium]
MDIETLKRDFRAVYGQEPQISRAPGRVNLIGEHTDYNEGFVMPAAIDFYTSVAIAPRSDTKVNVRSQSFDEAFSLDLNDGFSPKHNWSDYVVGVIDQIKRSGECLHGADILVHGEVPIGAGLSSSAAIEVAVAFALLNAKHVAIDRKKLALLCQRAENEFVGMRCGIMDQFISCNGRRDHALMLDCRSLEFKLLPLAPSVRMVICNTMVKHQHASGEYNQRRAACEEGVRILRQYLPAIRTLRDVSPEQLEQLREKLPSMIYRRCRHVVTENARVESAAENLEANDLRAFGRLMAESHRSLRDDYEVSCHELDVMVEIAIRQAGIYGARMTGGGFGGCTINLVASGHAEAFRKHVAAEYSQATGLRPDVYITSAADGVASVA